MAQRAVDTVIFDLGGVLMKNGSPRDLARQFPADQVQQVIGAMMGPHHADTDHPWHRLERGEISFGECRSLQQGLLEAAGIRTPERPERPVESFQFLVNTDVIVLVEELRAAGLRTGMLTNNVREFRDWWWKLQPWDELFDDVVDSHEVGLRKPNPAIYELALDRLGADRGRTAFCDDIAPNVDAADALGMHGVLVAEDPAEAITRVRWLSGLG